MSEKETMMFPDLFPSGKAKTKEVENPDSKTRKISETKPFLQLEIPEDLKQKLKKKVLLIEDDEGIRFLIASALRFENYDVLEAENGLEGFELAKKNRPDLIISDVMMPQMDGFETLSRLKADPVTASIPFIFLTTINTPSSIRLSRELGADNFIVKPFKAGEVLKAIEQQITSSDY